METLFYVLGVTLVLLALAISFLGMRSESFPSTGMLRGGVALFAVVVVATAYGAVGSAQDEQEKRLAEQNVASSEEEAIASADNDASGSLPADGGQAPGARDETDSSPPAEQPSGASGGGDPEAGAAVFASQGCGSCHTLKAGGPGAVGEIGPNLDAELVDQDASFIETSIVDPSAEVEEGFSDGIMPQDYADVIPPDDLQNLVAYLAQATGESGSSGSGAGSNGSK